MHIVIAEKVSPATLEVLRQHPEFTLTMHDQVASPEALQGALGQADALIVRSAVQVDEALLQHAPRLRVVGRAGVGTDNIDLPAAHRRNIVVMNTPGANAVAVAELTFGLMLAMARQLPQANSAMHAGRWEKKTLAGSELRGKTLAILGLGRIGQEVARRARVFGMRLIGHDPFVTDTVALSHDLELVALPDLFRRADYLTLHLALTPETERIVRPETLAWMKPQARIVNCARGELIDEGALAAALRNGTLAGAALDVFAEEPPRDSPFAGLSNVILTPHIGGSTAEAQEAVGIQIAEQIATFLLHGVAHNAVAPAQ